MISITFSPSLDAKKQAILLPLFREKQMAKNLLEGLSSPQKEQVKQVLRQKNLPIAGMIPVFSAHAPVLLYFLGEKKKLQRREAREAGEKIYEFSKKFELEALAILPGVLTKELLLAFREGVMLGSYEFSEWKGKEAQQKRKKEKRLGKIQFVGAANTSLKKRLEILAESVKYAKDIVNLPPMTATPTFLTKLSKEFAKKLPKTTVKILEERELKKLGFGGILGVGQGTPEESRLIFLKYSGGQKEAPLALVGKGVTYDTGGLSIKPAQYMITMKQDLGGAATVLGAFYAIAASGVKKNVLAVVPTVENLVSAAAYKPDDILHMYNGKTVEVTNTDAEGRLILADALAYTEEKFKPRAMVDLATLTGACLYAVGEDFAAVLGTDRKLVKALQQAAERTDELIWELPLHERYKKYIESSVADIVNASYKLKAGTIEGALFLQNFVTKKTPWCHLDIASVTFDTGKNMATGRNVRLLWDFVEKF